MTEMEALIHATKKYIKDMKDRELDKTDPEIAAVIHELEDNLKWYSEKADHVSDPPVGSPSRTRN